MVSHPFAAKSGIGQLELEELPVKGISPMPFRLAVVPFFHPPACRRRHPQ